MKRSAVSMEDSTSGETSLRMLDEARVGGDQAWRRLIDRYSRRVYRWCRCSGLQAADASNVTQEVFRALARKLPDFERGPHVGSFRCWIRTIAKNKIHDHFRQMGRQLDVAAGGTDAHRGWAHVASHAAAAGAGEATQTLSGYRTLDATWLSRIRAEFSDRDWRFFWRLVVDGQSAVDVADEFGVTANAVRLVKMRILRRLREGLNVTPDATEN